MTIQVAISEIQTKARTVDRSGDNRLVARRKSDSATVGEIESTESSEPVIVKFESKPDLDRTMVKRKDDLVDTARKGKDIERLLVTQKRLLKKVKTEPEDAREQKDLGADFAKVAIEIRRHTEKIQTPTPKQAPIEPLNIQSIGIAGVVGGNMVILDLEEIAIPIFEGFQSGQVGSEVIDRAIADVDRAIQKVRQAVAANSQEQERLSNKVDNQSDSQPSSRSSGYRSDIPEPAITGQVSSDALFSLQSDSEGVRAALESMMK